MKCEACGREIDQTIELEWSNETLLSHHQQKYKVCGNCNNDFVIAVSDYWARLIAGRREMGDPKDSSFPPLICDGGYREAYQDVPYSKIIREEIIVLLNNLVQQVMFEEQDSLKIH